MDTENYTQEHVPGETLCEMRSYLLENITATHPVHDATPAFVELPAAGGLTLPDTAPGVQGDRSTGGTKPATLETGATVAVPLFITTGERIRVDTRPGDYLGRVN